MADTISNVVPLTDAEFANQPAQKNFSGGIIATTPQGALRVDMGGASISIGDVTITTPEVGSTGSNVPTEAALIAGADPNGKLTAFLLDSSGNLKVTQQGTVIVNNPTAANLLATVYQGGTWTVGLASGSTIATTQSGTWNVGISGTPTFNLGTLNGAATDATLSTMSGKIPALGQALKEASLPVVISSDQGALTVSGTVTANVAGVATETTLAAASAKLPTSLGQKAKAASMSVVIASDQGAIVDTSLLATEATLSTMSGKIPALGQTTKSASLPVTIASDETVPVSGTVSVTGVATETTLAAASAKLPASLGQKTKVASMSVVLSSDQDAIPITGSITANNGSVGTNTANIPTQSTLIAGKNGSGVLTPISVDATGAMNIVGSFSATATVESVSATGADVPVKADYMAGVNASGKLTGVSVDATGKLNVVGVSVLATEATLSTLSGKIPAEGQAVMASSLPVVIASNQSAIPVSGTVSVTGVATETTLSAINTKTPSLGQSNKAGSVPVTLASDQGSLVVSQSTASNLNATVTMAAGQVVNIHDGSAAATIKAASTAAVATDTAMVVAISPNNSVAITNSALTSLDTKTPSVGQAVMASSTPVVIASNQSAIPVSGTVTANIGTTNGLALDATVSTMSAKIPSLGQTTKSASLPVTLATDQALVVSQSTAANLNATVSMAAGQVINIHDGTAGATIKAASTAAVATDTAMVVAISPNNSVAITNSALTSLDTKTPSVGQAVMASSRPVVIASNQSAVPISGAVALSGVSGNNTFGYASGILVVGTVSSTYTVSTQCAAQMTSTTPAYNATYAQGIVSTAGGSVTLTTRDNTSAITITLAANQVYPILVKTITATSLTDIVLFI